MLLRAAKESVEMNELREFISNSVFLITLYLWFHDTKV